MIKKEDLINVRETILYLKKLVYNDCCVDLNEMDLIRALEYDLSRDRNFTFPTKEECELLVEGDAVGDIPEVLEKRYPVLNKLLNDLLT